MIHDAAAACLLYQIFILYVVCCMLYLLYTLCKQLAYDVLHVNHWLVKERKHVCVAGTDRYAFSEKEKHVKTKNMIKDHNEDIVKANLYKTAVRPSMMYGVETWAEQKAQEKKLYVVEMRTLRWMSGVTKLDRIRNQRIRGTTKVG